MRCKTFLVLVFVIISHAMIINADSAKDKGRTLDDEPTGYILLDSIVSTFNELSASGKGGRKDIEPHLLKWWKDVHKAQKQGLIDQLFFKRYKRILKVIMLSVVTDEKNIIINSLIYEEINKFDIPAIDDTQNLAGIGSIARALSKEISSLKKYLNGKTKPNQKKK